MQNKSTMPNTYDMFAVALEYPDQHTSEAVRKLLENLQNNKYPGRKALQQFFNFFEPLTQKQKEELYTHTFDVQAITTMDVGYILFGEDYKRGKLLVHLNREHREAGVDCRGQLSDYLPNMLLLIERIKDQTLKKEMVVRLVIPALQKIKKDFSKETIRKKQKIFKKHQKTLLENPVNHSRMYLLIFDALLESLQADFEAKSSGAEKPYKNYESDFQTEMKNSEQ